MTTTLSQTWVSGGLAAASPPTATRRRNRSPSVVRAWRLVSRFIGFSFLVLRALGDYASASMRRRRTMSGVERAVWLRRWSQRALVLLQVRVTAWGTPPDTGLLVANHLG